MSVTDWKLEKDLCRCCHAEGSFKNLSVPCYKYDGEEEIYVDMIRDHMNLDIIQVQGALQSVTFTICDLCIAKLRDVTTFRRQVMSCEERFRDMYSRNVFKVGETTPDVKVEVIELDDFGDVKGEDNDDDDFTMNFSDEEDIKAEVLIDIKQEPSKKGKGKGKATPKAKKRPAPKRAAKAKKGKKAGGDGEEDKVDDADKAEDEAEATASLADTTKRASKRDALASIALSTDEYTTFEYQNRTMFRCGRCKTSYSYIYNLKLHFIKAHQCPHCPQILDSQRLRRNHEQQDHPEHTTPSTQTYSCKVCQKVFKDISRLKDHLRRSHKQFQCRICKAEFPFLSQLDKHQYDAHGKQKHKCGVCDYETVQKSSLKDHVRRVHMNEKHVQCPVCHKQFYNKGTLNDHLVRHTREKKHECKVCGKCYPRLGTLKMHMRIHTGEKRKVCRVCDEAFVQKSSLNHHMMKHHPDKV